MTTIQELQKEVKKLVTRINNKHKHDRPELISYMKLVEEVGEISEVLLSGEIDSRKEAKKTKEEVKEKLGDEIADSIITLVGLANDFDIDLPEAIQEKLKIHSERN